MDHSIVPTEKSHDGWNPFYLQFNPVCYISAVFRSHIKLHPIRHNRSHRTLDDCFGNGNSNSLVALQAAASIGGAVVGQAVEEVATRKIAQEITVRLDDGRTVVVTQEVTGGLYQDGDRVRIVNGGGGGARVMMAPN